MEFNWLDFLLIIFSSIMSVWCAVLTDKLKKKQQEKDDELEQEEQEEEQKQQQEDALKEAVKAILHDLLFQLCETYLALGYIPVDESEKVRARGKVLWKGYSGIGGNSTGEDIYNEFTKLPTRNPDTA